MNLKVRLRNPLWWIQILATIFLTILGYFGLTGAQITSWPVLFQTLGAAIANPYVLFLCLMSIWNTLHDPTTTGLGDSARVKGYEAPHPCTPSPKT